MPAPRLSIVIVAHGRREVTERCLQSIEAALGEGVGASVELVLVDNASPDDTRALFEVWRDRATIVVLDQNRNFAGGCNAGASAAQADVVIFLNNDTVVEPGALEALAEQARSPDAGAVGLRLLYLDGTLQHAGVAMIRVPSGLPVPHHLFHHQDGWLPAARVSYELDAVTAACLAIRRDLFLELGGYDEGYVNGWEDVDLCLRVRVAGKPVVYRGDLWLWHAEGQTRGQVTGADANAERFYRRWRSVLDSDEELIEDVFGARLSEHRPIPRLTERAEIVVSGLITGVSTASAEARGLLAACEAVGARPAARQEIPEMVIADLGPEQAREVHRALAREPRSGAPRVHVPHGPRTPPGAILRLAQRPTEPLQDSPWVWAASPALREVLIADGLKPERVAWVPSCVPARPPGAGGRGLLCVLPGHDLAAAEAALDALAPWGGERLRLLPTARSIPLLALVADRLPKAELLAPCTSETRLHEIAAGADVVLCADPDDIFERRSLVAAAAGSVTVTAVDGPAHAVLGELAVTVAGFSAADLRYGLKQAVAVATRGREQRAAAVRGVCSERICGEQIAALIALATRANAA